MPDVEKVVMACQNCGKQYRIPVTKTSWKCPQCGNVNQMNVGTPQGNVQIQQNMQMQQNMQVQQNMQMQQAHVVNQRQQPIQQRVQNQQVQVDVSGGEEVVTMKSWFITYLLLLIPILNLIFLLIWSIKEESATKRNWARVTLIISLAVFVVLLIVANVRAKQMGVA